MITHMARPGGAVGTDLQGKQKRASVDSLESIGREYGVPWEQVAVATFGTAAPAQLGGQKAGLIAQAGGVKLPSGWWALPEGFEVRVPVDAAKSIQVAPVQAGILPSWKMILMIGLAYGAYRVFIKKDWKLPFLRGNPEHIGLYCPHCKDFMPEDKLTIGEKEIHCVKCGECFEYFWGECETCEDDTPHTTVTKGEICIRCGTVEGEEEDDT